MGAAARPVDPGEAPVRVEGGKKLGDQRGQVVLVGVAGRTAEVAESGAVVAVGDGGGGQAAVYLEPLGALAPVWEGEEGAHAGVVAAASGAARVVEGGDEAEGGGEEEAVEGGEVEQGNARLRQEKETSIGGIEEGVRQQPPLRRHHAPPPPFYCLQRNRLVGKQGNISK